MQGRYGSRVPYQVMGTSVLPLDMAATVSWEQRLPSNSTFR
jgi:hypothetical protein